MSVRQDAFEALGGFRSDFGKHGLGKARLLRYATKAQALASERRYVRSVLPRGVLRGVGDAVVRRDAAGLRRSTAIVAGLGITVAGYLYGRLAT